MNVEMDPPMRRQLDATIGELSECPRQEHSDVLDTTSA
jgi:hypothetical protein